MLVCKFIEIEIGRKPVFDEHRKDLYNQLFEYFTGISNTLDLSKGVALVGTYGVGKSTSMNVMHNFLKNAFPFKGNNLFRIVSVEEIINDYSSENFINSVNLYNVKQNVNGIGVKSPVNILINEFGHDYKGKNFGTNYAEIFDMFMMKRYDIFQQQGKLTHITTNYYPSELEKIFSARLVDRFKEMFNWIDVDGNSLRK